MRDSWLDRRSFLPDEFQAAHDLCYMHHDVMLELLRAGEKRESFGGNIQFRPGEEPPTITSGEDVLAWLERTERTRERAELLRSIVFPALLSDFLHFAFEALYCSQRAKLTVAFALLRKPLQDTLGLLETIAVDLEKFASHLSTTPEKLDAKKAGGQVAHAQRIQAVLELTRLNGLFDAPFLAQLRYDKTMEDSFAGSCDKALHLFTGHAAVKTEPMNINFIFTDEESRFSQWAYLYSRLPYVMDYARRLIEHVFGTFEARTDPCYLEDIDRRLAAGTVLWVATVDDAYMNAQIQTYVDKTVEDLASQCSALGVTDIEWTDLPRLRDHGLLPNARWLTKRRRDLEDRVRARVRRVTRRLRPL